MRKYIELPIPLFSRGRGIFCTMIIPINFNQDDLDQINKFLKLWMLPIPSPIEKDFERLDELTRKGM